MNKTPGLVLDFLLFIGIGILSLFFSLSTNITLPNVFKDF